MTFAGSFAAAKIEGLAQATWGIERSRAATRSTSDAADAGEGSGR
jgi:hypothetical protein